MSHPGPGPDMNPSGQQPGQPGQPFQPGQPAQPGQPGQPYQPFDQQPGQPGQPFGQQPGQPAGAWTPPGGATPTGEPAKKGGALKKVLPIVGGVVVLGVAASAFGLFGAGEPDVGDCIKGTGMTEFEEVDCGSDEAEGKVVGVDEQEMTYEEFQASEEVCFDFKSAEIALWVGPEGEDGKVFCAEPV